jgi:short subunit fatty acids transporter
MTASLLNWGFSLIVGAILAREVARRVPMADYRALGASSFLGLGTVWAQGISGSAALQMARASSMPPALARMVGEIPLSATILRWQSLLCVAVEVAVVTLAVWLYAPGEERARPASALGSISAPESARACRLPRYRASASSTARSCCCRSCFSDLHISFAPLALVPRACPKR